MHTNLILLFKHSSILVIELFKVVLSRNSYCNTIIAPSLKAEGTCLIHTLS